MSNTPQFQIVAEPLDIIVIGGGINGAGIACEAASRGLKVGLYEAKDFAMATSSASSKLLHGGLRYLEHLEFRLVKEALSEREILLKKAAHIVKPMRFRLPYRDTLRPKWLIRTGLFLYDHLARRGTLQASQQIAVRSTDGLAAELKTAFEYSDCWVDDSRLVISNIKHAHQQGAEVRNYCEVRSIRRGESYWCATLYDQRLQSEVVRYARAVVNATGPWAAQFLDKCSEESSQHQMQLVKGSHLIVKQLYPGDHAYILQNEDKRVIFVIPYLDKYSMIGTTDIPYTGDPYKAQASKQEIDYLLSICNQNFAAQLEPDDVLDSFSGVRPLFGQQNLPAQKQSRDYELVMQTKRTLPVLSVYGGKLTTYRRLSQKAVEMFEEYFPNMLPSESETSTFAEATGFNPRALQRQLYKQYPYLDKLCLDRLISLYGVATWQVLHSLDDSQRPVVSDLYQCEIDYLQQHEWAHNWDDILQRRTKLCYQLSALEREALTQRPAGL